MTATTTSRRAVLAGVTAIVTGAAVNVTAVAAERDPIFDAIDRYWITLAEHDRLFDRPMGDPEFEAAADAWLDAGVQLRRTVARTPQGLLGKLEVLKHYYDGCMDDGPALNELLCSIGTSVAGMSGLADSAVRS